MIDLLRKAYDGGANGLRTITCVMLFGVFLGGANSHVKASASRAVTAHQKTTKNATTLGTSTQGNKAQLDVSKLVGTDPGDLATKDNNCRLNPTASEYISKTFLLLNVGTEKFFNIGGAYGRHASLSNTGMYLWIWDNSTKGTYNIRTRLNYVNEIKDVSVANLNNADSYVQYLDDKEKDKQEPGIYPDCQPSDKSRSFGWKFKEAEGYSGTNKVYKISTYGNKYLTATPEDTNGNLCKAEASSNSDNQVWKLVTVQEYYDLFKNSPSDLKSPIDITFLMQNPGFGYNKSNAAFWASSGNPYFLRLGVEDYYKKTTEDYYKRLINDKEERIYEYNEYLYENGKYFCADIKNQHKYKVSQSINVTQPGWYIIRCNGFSNTNLANLFITDFLYFNEYITDENYKKTVSLKQLSTDGPKDLLEAGKKFYNGEYENEVRIYISQEDIESLGGQEAIYFGIELKDDGTTSEEITGEWTAFDNFRLLYAGESANAPDLVLDEDNPDLKYLTETTDEYKNCVLHLNRSFELNKWNTLILPVSLTYGQMRYAFGDDVKLAKLYTLTPNSVRFKTVECNSDDDVMLEAFTPYIIKPTKAAGQNPAYTTPRLLKAANQYWILDENEGISYEEEGVVRYTGGKVSIQANHYDIPGVTLDRTLLNKNLLDKHWVSTTTTSTTASDANNNKMVCKGTMAKTFYIKDGNGSFYKDDNEDRDKLSGDYFMNKGTMYKVPSQKQYGLKAFRCWFELTSTTDPGTINTSPAKDVKLFINEIEDETTGIGDIITDPAFSHAAYQYDGIYNLQGQLVRQGTSLEGLPQGIYIVKGKKVKK